jgi:hypothetical protein
LRRDYNDKAHVLSVFAFGRGNYSYISRDREWQQTINFFGKGSLAHARFMKGLKREQVSAFPAEISRPDVARFVFFRQGERPAGVWLVRQGPIYFTLPITTGTKPGVADYLPAPHGLPGFANPVEQVYASLVPFLQLGDGRTLVATDGADEITPSADGKSLRVVWRRWAQVGTKSGELVDPHITSEVTWRLDGSTLVRDETLRSEEDVTISRWWVAVPSTLNRDSVQASAERQDILTDSNSGLLVIVKADWPLGISAWTPGDSALGRGARRGVPLHLIYESPNLHLVAKQDVHWRMTLKVLKVS